MYTQLSLRSRSVPVLREWGNDEAMTDENTIMFSTCMYTAG